MISYRHMAAPNLYNSRCFDGLKIGILGGSFNPAHEGHRHISLTALNKLGLDHIWWMVTPQNPLKSSRGMMSFNERMESARKMANHPSILVTDIEDKLRTRYSFDTVRALKQRFVKTNFVWLMGADNLLNLHRWDKWQELCHLIPIATIVRFPYDLPALNSKGAHYLSQYRTMQSQSLIGATPPAWHFIILKRHSASSSQIRQHKKITKP